MVGGLGLSSLLLVVVSPASIAGVVPQSLHVYHELCLALALWFLYLSQNSASCQVPHVLLMALSSLSAVSLTPAEESALLSSVHVV